MDVGLVGGGSSLSVLLCVGVFDGFCFVCRWVFGADFVDRGRFCDSEGLGSRSRQDSSQSEPRGIGESQGGGGIGGVGAAAVSAPSLTFNEFVQTPRNLQRP